MSIKHSPQLPDGEYGFIDTYCCDPECDCRKTMIQVMHNGKLVSVINYRWKSAAFYEKWMGSSAKDHMMPSMNGPSIDITSPDLVSREGVLALFDALLNDIWRGKFKKHYKEVKSAISKTRRKK